MQRKHFATIYMIFITSNPGLLHQQLNSIQTFFIVISHSLLLFLWFQAIKHFEVHSWPPSSVTRFGEILLFWQNIEVIWQIFRRLFGVWKSFQPNFVKLMQLEQIFIVLNGKRLKK